MLLPETPEVGGEQKDAFYKVAYPDGRQGYISKSISMPEKNGGHLEAGRSQHYSYGA